MSKLMKSFFAVGIFLSAFGIIGVSAGGGYYGHNSRMNGTVGYATSTCSSNSASVSYTLQKSKAAGAVYLLTTNGSTIASCSESTVGRSCSVSTYNSGYLGSNHQHSFGDAYIY
ncbi:hypothetical protein [Amedibacillus sp. YH-ame10]